MASRKLERIGIDPSTCEKLARHNIITIRDLLTTPAAIVLSQVDIDLAELNRIVALASAIASGKPQSGLEILHARTRREQFLGCGVEALNRAMKGGLLVGTISEICGSPGAGKTQFCLNCVLQAIVPSLRHGASSTGEGASVIYIDTELKFDPKRLVQMAATRFPELYSSEVREDAVHQVDALLDRVRVARPASSKELQAEIERMQSEVISQRVTLVVIDSISALARKEGFNEKDKEAFFLSQASLLKKMAEACHCVVLATNQVTPSRADSAQELYGDAIFDDWGTYQPTLGPTWHHCVSTRLTMRKAGRGHEDALSLGSADPTRCLSLTKSPVAAPYEVRVVIAEGGICALEDVGQAPR